MEQSIKILLKAALKSDGCHDSQGNFIFSDLQLEKLTNMGFSKSPFVFILKHKLVGTYTELAVFGFFLISLIFD